MQHHDTLRVLLTIKPTEQFCTHSGNFSEAVYKLYQSAVKDTKTITKVILITCYEHTGENFLLAKYGTTSTAGGCNITNVTAVYT
jgi:hypothetical protein